MKRFSSLLALSKANTSIDLLKAELCARPSCSVIKGQIEKRTTSFSNRVVANALA
jgi:hypothetical protein